MKIRESGLRCDNPECDWKDDSVVRAETEKWVDVPCPKCSWNLLTKEDFERWKLVMQAAELVNDLPEEELLALAEMMGVDPSDETKLNISVDTHKEIVINIKRDEPKEDQEGT